MHNHPCSQCDGTQQCDLPNCEIITVVKPEDKEGHSVSYPAVCDSCRQDNTKEEDEHQRLADAVSVFIDQLDPDFYGDMPRAMSRLAAALERKEISFECNEDIDISDVLS